MARRTVRVNIHNVGKFMGVKTPVYNFPMDYETYVLCLQMGMNIELYHPEYDPRVTAQQKMSETFYEDQAKKAVEVPKVEEKVVTQEPKKGEEEVFDACYMKAVYTKDELESMSKIDLIKILAFRGHRSSKTGKRDSLAPRYDDNKTILKDKVMKSNRI